MANYTRTNNFLYAKGGWSLPVYEEADPADDIAKNLSNIVLEQNVKASSYSGTYLEQDFYLPTDYARDNKIPSLTGAQVYLNADKNAVIKYRLSVYDDALRQREITENKITAATGNGTVVTYTTELPHYLDAGDFITITGFDVNGFNGSFTIETVPTTKTFTVKNTETGTTIVKYGRLTQPPREAKMFGNTWYLEYKIQKKYLLKKAYRITKFNDKKREVTYEVKATLLSPTKTFLPILKNKYTHKYTNSFIKKILFILDYESFEERYRTGYGYEINKIETKKIKGKKNKRKDRYELTIFQKRIVKLDNSVYESWKKEYKNKSNVWFYYEYNPNYYHKNPSEADLDYAKQSVKNINAAFWIPWEPKNKTITVKEAKTIAKQELLLENMAEYREPLIADSRYDSEFGWEGVIEGEITVKNDGDQWIDIKFESLEIPPVWLNKKFKLTIQGSDINHFYYASPSSLVNKAQAHKSDGTPLSANTASAMVRILAGVADAGVDFLTNEFRSSASKQDVNKINSGNDEFWSSKPNPSKYGVESLYFDVSNVDKEAVRIDSIYLDAITPGVKFNVYYSVDDVAPGTDVDSWDQRLWKWVPREYTAYSRKNYLFPNPISAKYIKVEFTRLQASHYNPGTYDKPILYKKHPSWVVNYFLSIYDSYHNKTEDPFIGGRINLEYDLLDLAYNYYKGDIIDRLANPVVIDSNNALNIVPNLLKNAKTELEPYDQISLTNINMLFDQFRKHPGYQSRGNVVGRAATIKAIDEYFNYQIEKLNIRAADTSIVSTTNRNHLLLEKSMPHMYFYPTCRHLYREAYAKFENNKAYFVKIREIKFGQGIHNVMSDEKLYKFKPSDINNSERSDFISTVNKDISKWSIT